MRSLSSQQLLLPLLLLLLLLLLHLLCVCVCQPLLCVLFQFLQLLGLLLPKYVPDESLVRQPSWVGVVHNADALVPMLQQHVIEPLLQGKQGVCWCTAWERADVVERVCCCSLPATVPCSVHLSESAIARPTCVPVTLCVCAVCAYVYVRMRVSTAADDMPPGETDWALEDDRRGGFQGWWSGSYVLPAVLATGIALTGVAAFVYMKRRRML